MAVFLMYTLRKPVVEPVEASDILENEIGPVEIYPGSDCFRFMGQVTVVY